MHIGLFLLGHGGHALGLAGLGRVVMAHEQLGVVRQAEHFLDRLEQHAGTAPRKVAARRTVVGHEQGVAHKGHLPRRIDAGICDHIGHARRGVAGGVQSLGLQSTNLECLAIAQQAVELATVAGKFGARIEQLAKHVLHLGDVRTNGQLAAQLLLQIGRGRQMVSVHMRLQNPLHTQVQRLHTRHQLVGAGGAGAARLGVVVQHAVDQGALPGAQVGQDVAEGERGRIKKRFNVHVG